jgi:hypothetical protein
MATGNGSLPANFFLTLNADFEGAKYFKNVPLLLMWQLIV